VPHPHDRYDAQGRRTLQALADLADERGVASKPVANDFGRALERTVRRVLMLALLLLLDGSRGCCRRSEPNSRAVRQGWQRRVQLLL